MQEYSNESEMETDVMRVLINTGDYCLVKRQFMIMGADNRLDLLCITNKGFHMVIFELKRKFTKSAIVQAEKYALKYNPKACFLIVNYPLNKQNENFIRQYTGLIGICHFDGTNLICIRKPRIMNSELKIELDIMKRLNPEYMTLLSMNNNSNQWWNDLWMQYSSKILKDNNCKISIPWKLIWRRQKQRKIKSKKHKKLKNKPDIDKRQRKAHSSQL